MAVLAIFLLFAQGAYDEGLRLLDQKRLPEAAAAFQRAADEEPRNAQRWKALGVAYAMQEKYDKAEPAFARACALDPKLVDACYFHARALYTLNRFEESLKILRSILGDDRKPSRVHLGIGQDLEALGRVAESEPEYKLSLSTAPPGYADPYIGYAQFLLRQGRAGDAVPVLTSVIAMAPRDARGHYELGRAYYQLERLDEAAKSLETSAALDSRSSATHLLLGRIYAALGRTSDAKRELDLGKP